MEWWHLILSYLAVTYLGGTVSLWRFARASPDKILDGTDLIILGLIWLLSPAVMLVFSAVWTTWAIGRLITGRKP